MGIDLYQPFTNPITHETFRCLSNTEDAYVMEWIVEPNGYVPFEHIHVSQDEIFHVKKGKIRVLLNRRELIGKAGDTVAVPRGTPHIAYNDGSEPLVCTVEYQPGLDMFKYFQCFGGLTNDCDIHRQYGINIPKMMYFMKKINPKAMARPAFVPAQAFSLLMSTFFVVGTLAGWERQYKKYTE